MGAGTSIVRPINASYLLLGFALRPALMQSCNDMAVGMVDIRLDATQIAITLGTDGVLHVRLNT